MNLHLIGTEVDGYVGLVQKIIGKIFFDDIAFVAQANHKIIEPVGRINFHDVPQNRHTANLDHWFWPDDGFFA